MTDGQRYGCIVPVCKSGFKPCSVRYYHVWHECLYALLAGCDADIAACSHFRDKGGHSAAVHATGRTFVYSRDEALAQLAEDKRIRNYAVDKLYRRSLFEDIAFPPGRYFEDIAVMCRLFAKASAVAFREVPKYHYCVRQGSIMQGRYNPMKEYHFFLGLYEQYVFLRAECPAVDTSVQVVRRGLHLLELEAGCHLSCPRLLRMGLPSFPRSVQIEKTSFLTT